MREEKIICDYCKKEIKKNAETAYIKIDQLVLLIKGTNNKNSRYTRSSKGERKIDFCSFICFIEWLLLAKETRYNYIKNKAL